jgi:hypothetical protein
MAFAPCIPQGAATPSEQGNKGEPFMSAIFEERNVFVQNYYDRKFVSADGQWTADHQLARDFHNTEEAVSYVVARQLAAAQLLIHFNGLGLRNVIVPLT